MLSYCGHALRQMKKRGIYKEDVQFCLGHYSVHFIPKEGYEIYIAKLPNGKRLQVVINRKKNQIVTALALEE